MDLPPWARPFIRETTWKHEALSRPLQGEGPLRHLRDPNHGPHAVPPGWVCPGRPEPPSAGVGSQRCHPLRPPVKTASQRAGSGPPPLPGGLIEEHDRRIVDELQRDGQALALAAREAASSRVGARQQAQGRQDLLDLGGWGRARVESGTAQHTSHLYPQPPPTPPAHTFQWTCRLGPIPACSMPSGQASF